MSKIVFWAAGFDGSGWYRNELPAEMLIWQGHNAMVTEKLTPKIIREADVIVGSRIAQEGPTLTWQAIAGLPRAERPRLVLDVDDAYFSVQPDSPAASFWCQPDTLRRLAENMAVSDIVLTATEGIAQDAINGCLAHDVRLHVPKVEVIPNGLHASLLGTPREYLPAMKARPLVIGWSGSPHTAPGFDMIARTLGRLLRLYGGTVIVRACGLPQTWPGIRHVVTGMGGPHVLKDEPELAERFQVAEWVHHGVPYLEAIAGFDLMVAPYPRNPFNDAKFPTKALEAGFLGIPLVASATPPFRDWLKDGVELGRAQGVVMVPENAEHLWSSTIRNLIDQPKLRRVIGENARSRAAMNIMQSLGSRWAEVVLG